MLPSGLLPCWQRPARPMSRYAIKYSMEKIKAADNCVQLCQSFLRIITKQNLNKKHTRAAPHSPHTRAHVQVVYFHALTSADKTVTVEYRADEPSHAPLSVKDKLAGAAETKVSTLPST